MSKLALASCLAASFTCFATAHADLAVNFPLVNNSSAPELAGYVTQDIQIYSTQDWTAAGMILELSSGSIYQDTTERAGDQPPNPLFYSQYPSLEFDTYLGTMDGHPNGIAGPAGDLGSTLTGWGYQLDTTGVDATWFNLGTDNRILTSIGRLSLSDDAQGSLRLAVSLAKKQMIQYEFNIVDGKVIPIHVCDIIGDDGCGYGYIGLDALDLVLNNWNQNVTPGDQLQGDYIPDGYVGLADLDLILSFWNNNTFAQPGELSYVIQDDDGFIGLADLDIVLVDWNRTVPPASSLADPSQDGYVGQDDINAILSEWNIGTPPYPLPEPATLLTITLTAPLLLHRKRTE